MNYCQGCHTADYQRYSRLAEDIGLSEADMLENMVFTTDSEGEQTKVGSLIGTNMSKDYAKKAFGVVPPNLALVSRSRGVDWLYTYMKSFYLDQSRPLGANNTVYPNVGMPHVLADRDPNREARHSLGIKVMLFLFLFLGLAILLKKEYWKDIPHNS